ncbi:hypothetical protein KIPB_012488, partial [Kipferlia bialata]
PPLLLPSLPLSLSLSPPSLSDPRDYKIAKQKLRDKARADRKEEGVRMIPDTIERKAVADTTVTDVNEDDQAETELFDEFMSYFQGKVQPNILITTSPDPRGKDTLKFVEELGTLFHSTMTYRPRKKFSIKQIQKIGVKRGFTHLMIVHEDRKDPASRSKPVGMMISYLL